MKNITIYKGVIIVVGVLCMMAGLSACARDGLQPGNEPQTGLPKEGLLIKLCVPGMQTPSARALDAAKERELQIGRAHV